MNQLRLLLWSWIDTTRCLARGALWAPFVVYLLVQGFTIFLLTQFHQPLLCGVLTPLLRFLTENPIFGTRMGEAEAILHYPVFYLALPALFARFLLLLDLLLGVWILGIAFLLFWQADHPAEPSNGAIERVTRSWGKLIAVHIPATILIFILVYWLPQILFGSYGEIGGNLLRLRRLWPIMLGSCIEALFLYGSLAILVEGRTVGGAIRRSAGIAVRNPIATLGAVLIPNLVQIPISIVLARSETIILTLSPEVVAWLLFLCVTVYTIATFFIVGAGARLFRVRLEGPED